MKQQGKALFFPIFTYLFFAIVLIGSDGCSGTEFPNPGDEEDVTVTDNDNPKGGDGSGTGDGDSGSGIDNPGIAVSLASDDYTLVIKDSLVSLPNEVQSDIMQVSETDPNLIANVLNATSSAIRVPMTTGDSFASVTVDINDADNLIAIDSRFYKHIANDCISFMSPEWISSGIQFQQIAQVEAGTGEAPRVPAQFSIQTIENEVTTEVAFWEFADILKLASFAWNNGVIDNSITQLENCEVSISPTTDLVVVDGVELNLLHEQRRYFEVAFQTQITVDVYRELTSAADILRFEVSYQKLSEIEKKHYTFQKIP